MAWTKLPCRGLCLSPWERVWEQGPPRVSRSCPNVGDRAPGWVCPAGTGVTSMGTPHLRDPWRQRAPCQHCCPVLEGWWGSSNYFKLKPKNTSLQ